MSNRWLAILLIVVFVVFLVLLGVWFSLENNSSSGQATSTPIKQLTEEEKQSVSVTMFQFASTTQAKPPSSAEEAAVEQTMQEFQQSSSSLGVQEQQDILKIMNQFKPQ